MLRAGRGSLRSNALTASTAGHSAPARAELLGDEDLAKIAHTRQGADAHLSIPGPATFQLTGELLASDEFRHTTSGPLSVGGGV